MKTVFSLTFKSASRDPFLLLWSLILPVGGAIGLGLFIKTPDDPEHILTGMMAVSVLFYALTTTSFAILTQRRRGVYNLLRVTPMPLWRYVCSVSGAWTIISLLCAVLVMMSGALALQLSISIKTVLAILPALLIAALGYVFLSFVIASLSRTENNVSLLTNMITLPLMLSSSALYSLDGAPGFIQVLNRYNPFQWFVSALRSAFNLSWGDYWMNTGLILLGAIAACLLALKTFRYRDA
ncbi:ABC transporter permease [Paenibacillus sanguinis]|uniref:ABC transporter permease n=1 Tax=Paenibacillus sanguinis TaxID=225906 RepID=UPI00037890A2|nr:ABC transporter permease [Paenibacillus sanguinis]